MKLFLLTKHGADPVNACFFQVAPTMYDDVTLCVMM
jgi:hypothetical protein